MKIAHIEVADHDLKAIPRRWQVRDLAVFGSVLRDDFGLSSTLSPSATTSSPSSAAPLT